MRARTAQPAGQVFRIVYISAGRVWSQLVRLGEPLLTRQIGKRRLVQREDSAARAQQLVADGSASLAATVRQRLQRAPQPGQRSCSGGCRRPRHALAGEHRP